MIKLKKEISICLPMICKILLLSKMALSPLSLRGQENALERKGYDEVLEEMRFGLSQLFHSYQTCWDSVQLISVSSSANTVWADFLADPGVSSNLNASSTTSQSFFQKSGLDVGIKWTTDLTHNFKPGISESEDLFFGSRVSTGLDWVILGEGSWRKRANDRTYLGKKVLRDSLLRIDTKTQYKRQQQFATLAYLFDRYRLSVLQLWTPLRKEQVQFQAQMYKRGLSDYPTLLKSEQQYKQLEAKLKLLHEYTGRLKNEAVEAYVKIPLLEIQLPAYALVVENSQQDRAQELLEVEKELLELQRRRDNRDNVSLRSRLRYNYYNSSEHQPRGFGSVAVTLSVPLRTGKSLHDQIYTYESQRQEEQQLIEAEHRRNQLQDLYQRMSEEKEVIRSLKDELTYTQALMDRELESLQQEPNQTSPNKFIELADTYFIKLLELTDRRQMSCEDYIDFMYLTGSDKAIT